MIKVRDVAFVRFAAPDPWFGYRRFPDVVARLEYRKRTMSGPVDGPLATVSAALVLDHRRRRGSPGSAEVLEAYSVTHPEIDAAARRVERHVPRATVPEGPPGRQGSAIGPTQFGITLEKTRLAAEDRVAEIEPRLDQPQRQRQGQHDHTQPPSDAAPPAGLGGLCSHPGRI